jgi:hypothetical protein
MNKAGLNIFLLIIIQYVFVGLIFSFIHPEFNFLSDEQARMALNYNAAFIPIFQITLYNLKKDKGFPWLVSVSIFSIVVFNLIANLSYLI